MSAVSSPALSKRILVKFSSKPEKPAIVERIRAREISEIPRIDISVLEVKDIAEAIRSLRNEKIDFMEVDAVATTLTNDTLYSNQWALPKISWDKLDTGAGVYNPTEASTRIAVVDTGVDYNHPDLTGKVDTGQDWDFVNNDDDR